MIACTSEDTLPIVLYSIQNSHPQRIECKIDLEKALTRQLNNALHHLHQPLCNNLQALPLKHLPASLPLKHTAVGWKI